jgi:hypothetical protein
MKDIFFDACIVVLCIILIVIGLNATRGLKWPADLDQFRDIAMTQTILDGGYGNDAYYLGETMWYNPGYHMLLAAISIVSGKPVPEVVARQAVFLNILAPLAFYLLLRAMWGGAAAFFATAIYLFSNNSYPDWTSSLFSLSTFPIIVSQAFVYFSLLLFLKTSARRQKWKGYAWCGVMLGITFLFNTTAAFVAGGIIAISIFWLPSIAFIRRGRHGFPFLATMRAFAAVAIPAVLLASVFMTPLLINYRLKVRNLLPITWQWPPLRFDQFPHLLYSEALQLVNWLALLGLLCLALNRTNGAVRWSRRMFGAWLGICIGYYVYYYLDLGVKPFGINMPSFSPIHNLFFFLKAALFALSGYGLSALGRLIVRPLAGRFTAIGQFMMRRRAAVAMILFSCVSLALLFGLDHVYAQPKKMLLVEKSRTWQQQKIDLAILYDWIREKTRSSDVFLCDDAFGMRVISPAGRKVVATHPFFSSPYVDWNRRTDDRQQMMLALQHGPFSDFLHVAHANRVTYCVFTLREFRGIRSEIRRLVLRRPFMIGWNIVVLRLK